MLAALMARAALAKALWRAAVTAGTLWRQAGQLIFGQAVEKGGGGRLHGLERGQTGCLEGDCLVEAVGHIGRGRHFAFGRRGGAQGLGGRGKVCGRLECVGLERVIERLLLGGQFEPMARRTRAISMASAPRSKLKKSPPPIGPPRRGPWLS